MFMGRKLTVKVSKWQNQGDLIPSHTLFPMVPWSTESELLTSLSPEALARLRWGALIARTLIIKHSPTGHILCSSLVDSQPCHRQTPALLQNPQHSQLQLKIESQRSLLIRKEENILDELILKFIWKNTHLLIYTFTHSFILSCYRYLLSTMEIFKTVAFLHLPPIPSK